MLGNLGLLQVNTFGVTFLECMDMARMSNALEDGCGLRQEGCHDVAGLLGRKARESEDVTGGVGEGKPHDGHAPPKKGGLNPLRLVHIPPPVFLEGAFSGMLPPPNVQPPPPIPPFHKAQQKEANNQRLLDF